MLPIGEGWGVMWPGVAATTLGVYIGLSHSIWDRQYTIRLLVDSSMGNDRRK